MKISRLKSTFDLIDFIFLPSFLPQGLSPAVFFVDRAVENDEIFVNLCVKIDFSKDILYNILDCHIGGE